MTQSANKADPGAASQQRDAQQQHDRRDQQHQGSGGGQEHKGPLQTSSHQYPGIPLPSQHLAKPGLEADLEQQPEFLAPDYCGSGKLAGQVAIITGGDSGIGRAVAVLYARVGADVAIINTGSVTGLQGSKQLLDYATTKCAIHAFTMSLASSLLDQGIRVNAIAPGPVWTPLNPADQPPEKIARFGEQTDMRRPAQPQELSPAYVFLASAVCSSYITGIVLPVTGSVGS
jgi:hypothetical protein